MTLVGPQFYVYVNVLLRTNGERELGLDLCETGWFYSTDDVFLR